MMQQDIEDIILKRLSGEYLSKEEEFCFDEWYKVNTNQEYYCNLVKIRSGMLASSVEGKVDREKSWQKVRPARRISLVWTVLKYAAIIVLPLCIGLVFYTREKQSEAITYAEVSVQPGKKVAVLTLSTGKQIMLTDTIVNVKEKGMVISNLPDQVLVYNQSEDTLRSEKVYNTITVPRGGEYKLTLADGTTVWLNSDSYIRYPVTFSGDVRQVELRGEAYFEVAKNGDKPFVVAMNGYNVRVTGTQFNVRNYSNENLSTTLVEGRVQVEREGKVDKLVPGQQASLVDGAIRIEKVDMEERVAWRNGAFAFTQCRLDDIMEELARWYDLDIFYVNQQVKGYHFSAWFKRSSSIDKVIAILEKTQKISINLKGRILTVQDKKRN